MKLLLLGVMLAACAHVDVDAARKSLIKADADFAADVAARGVDAWAEAFAHDGVMYVPNQPLIRGREKIRALMADLGDPRKAPPALEIRWKPLRADVSNDGTLGWTYGNAVLKSARGENRTKYLTVWRKQPDGSWKVAADQGTPGWAEPNVAP